MSKSILKHPAVANVEKAPSYLPDLPAKRGRPKNKYIVSLHKGFSFTGIHHRTFGYEVGVFDSVQDFLMADPRLQVK